MSRIQQVLQKAEHDGTVRRTRGVGADAPAARSTAAPVLVSEADLFLRLCPAPTVGVTGTKGKTTTTFILDEILRTAGAKTGLIGTIEYRRPGWRMDAPRTTPESSDLQALLRDFLDVGVSHCVMEVSSHALHQGRCEAVNFASATFTNLSQDHLDYHKDMQSYFEAKAMLFDKAPLAAINIDDPYGLRLVEKVKGKLVTFSAEKNADLRYHVLNADIHGSTLEFEHEGKRARYDFPLSGWFNHQNAAAAAATALALGLLVWGLRGWHPHPV